jgi:2-C-methyl-D-erythritol 4-phosphate cytidylyltransferase
VSASPEIDSSPNCWAVVPAAGVGARMAADRPKQYLPLAGMTVMEHSLNRLLDHPAIQGGVVAISEGDEYWPALNYRHEKTLHVATGGAERCGSVLNALLLLSEFAQEQDWVLVHDAARPCLEEEDISRLIQACKNHAVGGILAMPAKDTIKRANTNHEIVETVDRSTLWHAFTPQMFRLGQLRDALTQAVAAGAAVTDEASALEGAGFAPCLVEGNAGNIKITRPEDLQLAEFYLHRTVEAE